ncbi:MAG: ADP-ribosylation factor-like protein, partial [Thermoanaerobaculum sp.]|nr:ADP-ribosylation factor-like protein [Thermoanaerobaculum sp.]
MVQFRPSAREIVAKIVYYGPPLGGKTTNLKMLWQGYPDEVRGELIVLPTGTDRTIFFDYLPLTFRRLRGMDLRIQLYTVPGQVRFDSTRQVVLRGVDGVVFVADSQRQALAANRESWANLKKNLALQGLFLDRVPHVLQFNKRDLADILSVEELNQTLNEFNVPFFEAVAIQGIGVEETLEAIAKLVVRSLRDRFNLAMEPQPGLQVVPQAAEDVATRPVSIKPQPLPRNGLGSREPLPPPELTPPTVPLEVVVQPRGGDVVALFPREESPGAAAVEQAQAASSAADVTPQTSAFARNELTPAPSEGGEPFLPASQPPTEQLAVSGDVAFFLPESGSISLVASPFELPGPDMAPQASPDLELFGQEPLRGKAQAEPSAPAVGRGGEVFAPP